MVRQARAASQKSVSWRIKSQPYLYRGGGDCAGQCGNLVLLWSGTQIVYTLVIATTVLIIACPCAWGWRRRCRLFPASGGRLSLGAGAGRRRAATRQYTRYRRVDKTGTLTEGKPQVVAVKTFAMLMKRRHCVWRRHWSKVPATAGTGDPR